MDLCCAHQRQYHSLDHQCGQKIEADMDGWTHSADHAQVQVGAFLVIIASMGALVEAALQPLSVQVMTCQLGIGACLPWTFSPCPCVYIIHPVPFAPSGAALYSNMTAFMWR